MTLASVLPGEIDRRGPQLWRWLYGDGKWLQDLDEADGWPDSFSKAFKGKVQQQANLSGGVTMQSVHQAKDGTQKILYSLDTNDGDASGQVVETVLIPMAK